MVLDKNDPALVVMATYAYNNSVPLAETAGYLDKLGYTSKEGKKLSASHVSNFERKDLGIARMKQHTKPTYKFMNHETCKWLKNIKLWALKEKMEKISKSQPDARLWLSDYDLEDISNKGGPRAVVLFNKLMLDIIYERI